ncbi:hypothetical protein LINGRAHAP2_LOCUS31160 [Linum grandiflorum]
MMLLGLTRRREVGMCETLQQYVGWWEIRDDHVAETGPIGDPERWHFHDQYMDWYRTFSRWWIGYRGAVHEAVVDGLEHLWITLGAQHQLGAADTEAFRETVGYVMHATGGMERRIDVLIFLPMHRPARHIHWDPAVANPLEQPAPPAAASTV